MHPIGCEPVLFSRRIDNLVDDHNVYLAAQRREYVSGRGFQPQKIMVPE